MNTRTSRVQPQRLHDHPLRVLALAQVVDSHRAVANDTVPLLQYFRLDLWVLGQQVQTPTCVRVAGKAKAGRQLHIISSCRTTHQRLVTAKLSFANNSTCAPRECDGGRVPPGDHEVPEKLQHLLIRER